MNITSFVLACLLVLTSFHAEAAKRFGGGKSIGQQSGNVTQREASRPATPASPNAAPNAAPNATPAPAPAAPAPAAAPRRPWGAMLGGLAAGLGLAWLAHSMGFGAEFGQFLMFGLIALGVVMVIGLFMPSANCPTYDACVASYARVELLLIGTGCVGLVCGVVLNVVDCTRKDGVQVLNWTSARVEEKRAENAARAAALGGDGGD